MKISPTERALLRFFARIRKRLAESGINGWYEEFNPKNGDPYIVIYGEYGERLELMEVVLDGAFMEEIGKGPVNPIVDRFVGPIKIRLGFTYAIDIVDPTGTVLHTVKYLRAASMYEMYAQIFVIRKREAITFRLTHKVYRFAVYARGRVGEYRIVLRNGKDVIESRTFGVGQ